MTLCRHSERRKAVDEGALAVRLDGFVVGLAHRIAAVTDQCHSFLPRRAAIAQVCVRLLAKMVERPGILSLDLAISLYFFGQSRTNAEIGEQGADVAAGMSCASNREYSFVNDRLRS